MMVRSSEIARESRAAFLKEAVFWQKRESVGVCREQAEKASMWCWGQTSRLVSGKAWGLFLRGVYPSKAVGTLQKSPVLEACRGPAVALAPAS